MKFLSQFIRTILLVETFAISALIFIGWILTIIQDDRYGENFFSYRIRHVDDTPAWFFSVLVLLIINGFWLFKLAFVEGGFWTPHKGPWGDWNLQFPINQLRIFAVNLVAIPGLIFAFIFIRQMGL
jgi:hypothetical protein